MIYTGYFKDINDVDYIVRITTDTGNQSQEITLGGKPFITEMDGSSDNIYIPAKYQTATVSVISPNYLFDVYTGKAQGTKVELIDINGNIIWTGYATPNLYNQGFVEDREEIEIECIDGLSTLQYIKYKAPEKHILSLAEILYKCLKQCNCYRLAYISNNTILQNNGLLYDLYISEENFFDEKKDDETDDDVAWTYQEVLEEICRFLGVTVIADKDIVWLVDYDSIKSQNPQYYRMYISQAFTPIKSSLETYNEIKTITGSDYADTGATISLTDVYNKVTVKDDLYTFNQLSPDIFSDNKLINITTEEPATIRTTNRTIIFWKPDTGFIIDEKGTVWMDTGNEYILDRGASGRKEKKYYFVASQYFKHPDITTYLYKWNGTPQNAELITYPEKIGWDDLQTYYGCFIRKEFIKEIDSDKIKNWEEDGGDEYVIKNATKDITKLSHNNYLIFAVCGDENAPYFYAGDHNIKYDRKYDTEYKYLPMFDYNIPKSSAMFGGKFAYILLTGSFILGHNDWDAYNKGNFNYNTKLYKSNVRAGWEYVYCRLQYGDQYWNGEEWTTTPSDFKLFFDEDKLKKVHEVTYKDLKIRNNVSWWLGINKEGYSIPIPENKVFNDTIKFRMYTPMQQYDDAMQDENDHDGRSYFIWLKDFKIEAVLGNLYNDLDFNSDTEYTNIINENYVNEMSDISFKICTWDNKKPNYSAVAIKDENGMKYLDKTINTALKEFETTNVEDYSGGLRQEEHLIYRLVNQYANPCIKLELTLHGNNPIYGLYKDTTINDRYFIADSISTDYRMNSQEITLIEKK